MSPSVSRRGISVAPSGRQARSRGDAHIDLGHLRRAHHGARFAFCDPSAEIQDKQPVDHGNERMDDVLDPDDGDAWSRGYLDGATSSPHSPSVSPPAISSRRRSRGSVASARASSSRFRSSRVSVPARRLASGRSPVRSRIDAQESTASLSRRRPAKAAPTSRFSNTVRLTNGCGIWNERAIPARARACGDARVVYPRRRGRTVPPSGRSAPAMRLKSEDLPAPFGPMMPSAAPASPSEVELVRDDDRAEGLAQRRARGSRLQDHETPPESSSSGKRSENDDPIVTDVPDLSGGPEGRRIREMARRRVATPRESLGRGRIPCDARLTEPRIHGGAHASVPS